MALKRSFGKYEIIKFLGEGATSWVVHARDPRLEREVTLKILKPALVADANAFARFAQEAQITAKLLHPHIASVLDMGEIEGRYFIAMLYVEGQSLDKVLSEKGPLTWENAVKLARQIGQALDFAHTKGFLHRDIKPSNIICTPSGDFVLTDFGLARAMMSTGLTSHTGAILGTPPYIAPESWQGEQVGAACDQYALACVIYEALTGQVLFDGDSPPAIMTRHVLNGPGSMAAWTPDAPARARGVLRKALSKDPKTRFANLDEFASALEKSSQPEPVSVLTEPAQPVSKSVSTVQPMRTPSQETIKPSASNPPAWGIPAITGKRRIALFAGAGLCFLTCCLIGIVLILQNFPSGNEKGTAVAEHPTPSIQTTTPLWSPPNTAPAARQPTTTPVSTSTEMPLPTPTASPTPSATATWVPTQAPSFYDNFDTGMSDDWEGDRQYWVVSNGVLYCNAGRGIQRMWARETIWDNYRLTITYIWDQETATNLRISFASGSYRLINRLFPLRPGWDDPSIAIGDVIGNDLYNDETTVTNSKIEVADIIKPGVNTLIMEISEGNIRVQLNGVQTHDMGFGVSLAGKVGLVCYDGSDIGIDEFSVQPLP